MSWTLGGVTIHPGDNDEDIELNAVYALQQVIDATVETITYVAAASERKNLKFVLFEDENSNTGLSTLKTAVKTDANVALVSDQGSQGNWRILSLKGARQQDHAHTYPTWRLTAELIYTA